MSQHWDSELLDRHHGTTDHIVGLQSERISGLVADNLHLTEENERLRFEAGYLDDLLKSEFTTPGPGLKTFFKQHFEVLVVLAFLATLLFVMWVLGNFP